MRAFQLALLLCAAIGAASVAGVAGVQVAAGGPTIGPGYAPGVDMQCANGGTGARDADQVLYVPCAPDGATPARIMKVRPDGTRSYVNSPDAVAAAPSPDGSTVYYIARVSENQLRLNVLRRARLVNGVYVNDAAFRFVSINGAEDACGYDIATDVYGYVYLSNGGWCRKRASTTSGWTEVPAANEIVKYRPDGTIVTRFGDWGTAPGKFITNMGITVTPDGRSIYVAESPGPDVQGRVQRFDLGATGRYGLVSQIRMAGELKLSATYNVELDPWGAIFITDTTAARVWKYEPDGTLVGLVFDSTTVEHRIHRISIDARSHVYAGEMWMRFPRAATSPPPPPPFPVPGPEPRTEAAPPVLASVSAVAETSAASVKVTLMASDDIGVDEMRFADESGNWGEWRPFAATVDLPLTPAGYGTKVITAQVRDAVDNESGIVTIRVVRIEAPDTVAPTLSVTGPEASETGDVTLSVTAADEVGVVAIRSASAADGEYSEWKPWSNGTTPLPVSMGDRGIRVRFVQVRDAAGNASEIATYRLLVGGSTGGDTGGGDTGAGAGAGAGAGGGGVVDGGGGGATTPPADRVAPRVRALVVPVHACTGRLRIKVAASDDRRVTQLRMIGRTGRWTPWVRFAPTMVVNTTPRRGYSTVTVQVRDAAGNVSTKVSRRARVVRCR